MSLSASQVSDLLRAEIPVVLFIQIPHDDLIEEAFCRLESDPYALRWDETPETLVERVCACVAAFGGGLTAGWLWL